MKFYSKFHPKEGKCIRLFGAVACRIMGLFRQPFENIRCIYFVAAHKLILNVSKIRLRLICARASYLHRLFSKAYGEFIFKSVGDKGSHGIITQKRMFDVSFFNKDVSGFSP